MSFIKRLKCFLRGHGEPEYLIKLNILAKIRCPDCDTVYCLNRETGCCLKWDLSWDYEFERMAKMRLPEEAQWGK